jgi:uncharacterized protein (TIGR03663 family)
MKRDWSFAGLMLIAVAGALALRLPSLERRPMHGDEAVHAVKFDDLWTAGRYQYDPFEYHGPTLYYSTLPVAWLSGAEYLGQTGAATFRTVTVLFGVGLILLLWLIRDGWGRAEALGAAGLLVLSPAMVFYSRYYIQETLLVFFTFLVIVAGWRYARTYHWGWALVAGVGLGLMHATKETGIIAFGAMAVALTATVVWMRHTGCSGSLGRAVRAPVLACAAVTAVVVSVLMFSALLTHPEGALDAWRAYPTYFQRAGGHGLHDHPWYYYLRMLAFTSYAPGPVWSEALILILAAFGVIAAFSGNRSAVGQSLPLLRFVAVYTVLMIAVYAAIPYKTPWCMLGFLHGLTLLGGTGAVALIRWLRRRSLQVVAGVLLAAAAGQLGWQAYRSSFVFAADPRNPYVYAHPVIDVVRLAERVEQLAGLHPDGKGMLVKVIGPDYWPLPWYFRDLTRVGYWEDVPEEPDAPVIIAKADLQPRIDARQRQAYVSSYYGLRPDVILILYVERTLWETFLGAQAKSAGP